MMLSTTSEVVEAAVAATEGVAGAEILAAVKPQMSQRPSLFRWSLHNNRSTVSEEDYVAPTEALIFLEVRPLTFALIWWGMVAVHTVCAVLLSVQTRLYWYLTKPVMAYYVNLVEPDINSKYNVVAAVFGVLAAFHWRTVILLVYTSIQQRKYAFFPPDHYELTPTIKPQTTERPKKWWQRVGARLSACRVALWGRRGLLGVESRYFYPYFYLREFIELTSQIWQAYRGSLLVSRTWINHLSVSIIVVNCLLTPAFQFGYRHRPEIRRISMLSVDAVLDFATAIIVPLSIFSPYFLEFDAATHAFPTDKMYDERWFVNAVLENQEFLIVSVTDLVFKCIPHISITGCLKKVRLLIQKDTAVRRSGRKSIYATVVAPSKRKDLAQQKMDRILQKAEAIAPKQQTANRAALLARRAQHVSRYTRKYANNIVLLAFISVGLVVLGIHLKGVHTSYRAKKVGCKQEMRPWFAPTFACSIFEVDCQQLNTTGTAAEIRQALSQLYAPAVAALIFTHCPGLEIPTSIQTFQHLMRLDFYNSTIARWDQSAALTNSAHPLLAGLTFTRVTFPDGELPDGMLSYSFPAGLRSVEISTTNLAQLPADLHDRWHHTMDRIFIEHSNLTQVPETLWSFAVEKLSLEGNAIAALDSQWLSDNAHSYLTLAVSCNPSLSALPTDIHPGTEIQVLHVHSTNVSSLPAWIGHADSRVQGLERVYASKSPLCSSLTAGSEANSNDPVVALVKAGLLSCSEDKPSDHAVVGRSACGLFPLDIVDRKRAERVV